MGEKSERQGEVMTEVECSSTLEDFAASGRTGRRNAVPDIQKDPSAGVGSADITFDMEKLKCTDGGSEPQASTSGVSTTASTSSSPEGATAS